MKFIFRGYSVFEYFPDRELGGRVVECEVYDSILAFNFCRFQEEDYKLLAQFFDTAYRHTQGEDVELRDIKIN